MTDRRCSDGNVTRINALGDALIAGVFAEDIMMSFAPSFVLNFSDASLESFTLGLGSALKL